MLFTINVYMRWDSPTNNIGLIVMISSTSSQNDIVKMSLIRRGNTHLKTGKTPDSPSILNPP